MRTAHGPLPSVPYPREADDIPSVVACDDGAACFGSMIADDLGEMLGRSERRPLVMGIALHRYPAGRPHRLRHLRRALRHVAARREDAWPTRSGDVLGFCASRLGDLVP